MQHNNLSCSFSVYHAELFHQLKTVRIVWFIILLCSRLLNGAVEKNIYITENMVQIEEMLKKRML